jgi:hypothetical protein
LTTSFQIDRGGFSEGEMPFFWRILLVNTYTAMISISSNKKNEKRTGREVAKKYAPVEWVSCTIKRRLGSALTRLEARLRSPDGVSV